MGVTTLERAGATLFWLSRVPDPIQDVLGEMHLFDPDRHEPLEAVSWDASVARGAIAAIAADAMTAARDGLWPSHPLDEGWQDGARTLYVGAAGVIWALSHLVREGAIAEDDRLSTWAAALPAHYEASPDTGSTVPSYFLGEAGVLLLALRAQRRADWSDRLYAAVESNVSNPTLEALWGAPGTILAAVGAYELTAEPRWRDLALANLETLTDSWQRNGSADCDLWTQDLYGEKRALIGAAHGFAGNAFAFFRGLELLPAPDRESFLARAMRTLRATATIDGNLANWATTPGSGKFLVQWCHGAPGIITSFGRAPADAELDELLVKGGELTWRAGPLRKGPGLCHGTAGSGAAMLTLFSRTGDSQWLDRARRLAMHGVRQVAAARESHGQGRYSLWTGDLGVAVHSWQCLTGASGMPSLDF
jgi:hypothetical protein